MDMGIGEETFDSGRLSAWLAAGVAVIIIAAIAGWIYL
jgi:succinate dehydrogenase / fumarate reductase cytochrome b subunit